MVIIKEPSKKKDGIYNRILELLDQEEDPELIQELDFAKEYLKEILS